MDVIIKSFNRPYYLEKCLRSVEKYFRGNYNIIILDDGTPEQYLKRIQTLFPSVHIHRSDSYDRKSRAIREHLAGHSAYNLKHIPAQFWKDKIASASNIFLLLEEDAWITSEIDQVAIKDAMLKHNIAITKLFWNGNENIVKGEKNLIGNETELILPKLPVTNLFLAEMILKNRFRIRSVLIKAGILDPQFMLPYYSLYTVSSAFFKKDFWLTAMENADARINEDRQLFNALRWSLNNKNAAFAKTQYQKVNTSYITTAVNSFTTIKFDFIQFNHIMNEAWLHGNLNPMQNFPRDFSIPYLSEFLIEKKVSGCTPEEWMIWITMFKGQYESLGCVID
jgi:glycosyltransferase involved in cell wall biosynthesis